jgi:hypothetical protein
MGARGRVDVDRELDGVRINMLYQSAQLLAIPLLPKLPSAPLLHRYRSAHKPSPPNSSQPSPPLTHFFPSLIFAILALRSSLAAAIFAAFSSLLIGTASLFFTLPSSNSPQLESSSVVPPAPESAGEEAAEDAGVETIRGEVCAEWRGAGIRAGDDGRRRGGDAGVEAGAGAAARTIVGGVTRTIGCAARLTKGVDDVGLFCSGSPSMSQLSPASISVVFRASQVRSGSETERARRGKRRTHRDTKQWTLRRRAQLQWPALPRSRGRFWFCRRQSSGERIDAQWWWLTRFEALCVWARERSRRSTLGQNSFLPRGERTREEGHKEGRGKKKNAPQSPSSSCTSIKSPPQSSVSPSSSAANPPGRVYDLVLSKDAREGSARRSRAPGPLRRGEPAELRRGDPAALRRGDPAELRRGDPAALWRGSGAALRPGDEAALRPGVKGRRSMGASSSAVESCREKS